MQQVAGMPRTQSRLELEQSALRGRGVSVRASDFERARLPRPFDESESTPECTHHAEGWLRRTA